MSAKNAIEAEQLAAKLAADCRRVHGLEHKITINAAEVLKDCKTRYVLLCLNASGSKLCDTKMMEKYVLSRVPFLSQDQGM